LELLRNEDDAFVRAILGHFFFVFIHPFIDGNGRIARFILNLFLISGGYNWTIIQVKNREQYMHGLESASVEQDIIPFTKFVISEMRETHATFSQN
jgi:Fic family protein